MVRSRYWLTSFSVQKKPYRSCTHSKYDTVTPPALQRMFGITRMPRSNISLSAPGVVGPLAASATIFGLDGVDVIQRASVFQNLPYSRRARLDAVHATEARRFAAT